MYSRFVSSALMALLIVGGFLGCASDDVLTPTDSTSSSTVLPAQNVPGQPGSGTTDSLIAAPAVSDVDLSGLANAQGLICIDMTDNFGIQWHLDIDTGAKTVNGDVDHPLCGHYDVTQINNIKQWSADNPTDPNCFEFDYQVQQLDQVAQTLGGRWRNVGDPGNGTWTGNYTHATECPRP